MKKLRKIKSNILLHPIMSFLLLIFLTIILSGILDVLDVSVNYSKINVKRGNVEATLVTVESLIEQNIATPFAVAVSSSLVLMILTLSIK